MTYNKKKKIEGSADFRQAYSQDGSEDNKNQR